MLTSCPNLVVGAMAIGVAGQCTTQNASTLEQLYGPRLSASTEIAGSTDANFSEVIGTQWSIWENPKWSGSIKPASIDDLQEVVKISLANNISFIATNGRHGPKMGQSEFTGININLETLNTVDLDTENNLVTLGPGVRMWDVQTAMYNAGKEIQTGNSICPGVLGVTLGAGIGMMTGMYGLIIDALKSVRMITAQGDVVTASSDENQDLFWALRGAGVNFGLVTEATYEIHEQTNNGNVTSVTFIYGASANRSVWEVLQTFDGNQPAKLSFQAVIEYERDSDVPIVVIQLWYFGPLSEAQTYVDRFAAAGPLKTTVEYLLQTDLYYQSQTTGVCDTGEIVSAHTLGFNQTDVASYEAHFADMTAFYQATPDFYGISVFQYYSNEVTLQTPASETAFPWRDIQVWWLTQNHYNETSTGPLVDTFMRGQRENLQVTSGFPTPHVYFNYAYGDEGPEAWYSEANLPELRRLKAEWDPNNVFGNGAGFY